MSDVKLSATAFAGGTDEAPWFELWVFADGRRAGRLRVGTRAALEALKAALADRIPVVDFSVDAPAYDPGPVL